MGTDSLSIEELIKRFNALRDTGQLFAESTKHVQYMATYLRIWAKHAQMSEARSVPMLLTATELTLIAEWLDELARRRHKAHEGDDDGSDTDGERG